MEEAAKRMILLVEDDPLISTLTSLLLGDFGYGVVTAGNGEDAVRKAITDERVSLVLMDIDLGPGIDGTRAAQEILAKRTLPIVFLTSHAEEEMVRRVRGITRYGYVIKNSGDFVLQSSIEMAYELFDAHRRIELQLEHLESSRERLDFTLAAVSDAIWDYYPEDGRLYWSPRYLKMLGYGDGELTPSVETWERLVHPQDIGTAGLLFRQCVEGEIDEYDKECRFLTASGEWRWVQIRGRVLSRNPDGRAVRMAGIHTDIHERKEAEEQRAVSARTLEDIIAAIPSGLFIYQYDKDRGSLCLIKANKAAVAMTGIDEEGWLGREMDEIWPNQSRYGLREKYLQVMVSGIPLRMDNQEYSDQRISGVYRIHAFPVPGQKLGIAFEDVTVFRRTEDTLRETETIFSEFLEHSPVYVFFKDHEIRSLRLSRNYEKMLGRPIGELLGKTMDDLFPSFLAKSMIADDKRILSEGREIVVDEELGGRYYTTIKFPICLDGSPRYLAGFTIDITDRKLALDESRASAGRIQKLLDEKELLLREVHHRIKNNMSTISNLLNLQADHCRTSEARNALTDAVGRINTMWAVYDTLFLGKDFRFIEVRYYLEKLLEAARDSMGGQRAIEISTSLDDDQLDSREVFPLGMIVNELVTNSYKYAFVQGGGRIHLEYRRYDDGGRGIFYRDDGQGLPEAVLEGTSGGFGMRLVRLLVRQLEATMEIKNEAGFTCTIRFSARPPLPV